MATYLNLTVSSNVHDFNSERRFDASTTVGQFKAKSELLTGISPPCMNLLLRKPDGSKLYELLDENRTLEDYHVETGMNIHIMDSSVGRESNGLMPEEDVPKYELSEEAYNARSDSVLAYKRMHGLGQFDVEGKARKEAEAQRLNAEGKERASQIPLGSRCEVRAKNKPVRRGVVRFVGLVEFKPGYWVGVQYDEPTGRNDGSVDGKRYFECAQNYGGFVRPQEIEVGDFPELLDDELDEL